MQTKQSIRPPSTYAVQVWNMVARRGMSTSHAAKKMSTSTWRIERIVIGVSRRNAHRWS